MSTGSTYIIIDESEKIILKLKSLFTSQEKAFYEYLDVIRLEGIALASQAMEKLEIYIELETDLIKQITAIQKVINPLEQLWSERRLETDQSLTLQKERLTLLKDQVKSGIEDNKLLLTGYLSNVKKELAQLAVSNSGRGFTTREQRPAFVDITR